MLFRESSPDTTLMAKFSCLVHRINLLIAFLVTAGVESAGSSSSSSSNVANPKTLSEMVRVRSFNYKSISLAYGPSFDAFCVLRYSSEKKTFTLNFGKLEMIIYSDEILCSTLVACSF